MSLLTLIVTLALVGLALYLVNLIPMEPTIKKILTIAVIVIVVLWVISSLGLFAPLSSVRIGR